MKISEQPQKCDYFVKVAVIGSRGCGKTNFINRFCYDDYLGYSKQTIGIDFCTAMIVRAGKQIKVQLWDVIIPQNDSDSIRQLCINGSIALIFTYSITDSLSFEYVQNQLSRMKKNNWISPSTIVYLIGTKADMKQQQKVDTEKAKQISEKLNAKFMQVSAKNRTGISEFQSLLGGAIYETIKQQQDSSQDNMVKKIYKILHN